MKLKCESPDPSTLAHNSGSSAWLHPQICLVLDASNIEEHLSCQCQGWCLIHDIITNLLLRQAPTPCPPCQGIWFVLLCRPQRNSRHWALVKFCTWDCLGCWDMEWRQQKAIVCACQAAVCIFWARATCNKSKINKWIWMAGCPSTKVFLSCITTLDRPLFFFFFLASFLDDFLDFFCFFFLLFLSDLKRSKCTKQTQALFA